MSDTRYLYDGGAFGAAPTSGNVTETDVYSANDPGVADHWIKQARDKYDTYGRVISSEDAAGNTTTTSYSSSYGTGLATTKIVVTDPLGHTTTTNINPAWGSPTDTIDANNEETSYTYDPLGRVTGVWLPGQSQSAGDPASYTYSYYLSSSGPSIVTTGTLINSSANLYVYGYVLFDSLLRARQTQDPAQSSSGGTEVTDTFYDSRGNTVTQNGPYPISDDPSTCTTDPGNCLFIITEPDIPNETASSYDGAGRLTEQALGSYGALQWKTSYAYPGVDAVTVTPPAGGTATTTYTDACGDTTDIYQYHSSSPPAAGTGSSPGAAGWDHTGYTYTPAGQLASLTDPAGNTWTYGYDLPGQQTTSTSPETGTTTSSYNDLGQLATVTDARGKTISYTYDADGRKTAEYDTTGGAAQTGSDELAAWTYDTPAVGQLATATSYVGGTGGEANTQTINSYDPAYEPTSTTYSVQNNTLNPALNGTYTFTAAYNTDGTIASQGYPQAGGLPAETVYTGYNNIGSPVSTVSSLSDYVMQSYYAPDGQPAETDLGTSQSAEWSRILDSYDPATARLTEARVQEESTDWADATDTSYGYDNAGDVTSISDSVSNDTQCLNYDYDQRLTAAWAQTSSTCPQPPPSPSGIGGPAPYLQTLSYDSAGAGNVTQDDLTVDGTSTDTTLTYPKPGQPQPHTPTTISSTVNGTTTTSSPGYDAAGNLQTTGSGSTAQTLTWNNADQLSTITDGSGDTTSYRYDITGNLLLRKDNNTTTLYLPNEEIGATGSTLTATRYYTHAGQIVAARTPTALTWLFPDPQGTDTVAIDTTTQKLTQSRYTPFGVPRGTPPTSWPGDHGFIGGTTDATTGLTNLGAREYSPTQATFVSPDPLLAPYDPQGLNPYDYAQDNPATLSDPTGQYVAQQGNPGCTAGDHSARACHTNGPTGAGNPDPGNPNPGSGYPGGNGNYGGGTNPDPGQYVLPERDRASYLIWLATWPDPFQEQAPAQTAVESIVYFCTAQGSDCPGNLERDAGYDADHLTGMIGFGIGAGIGAIGHGDIGGPADGTLGAEELNAEEDLTNLACGQSFTPTTKVLLANGKARPIADLKPGDKVLATNTRTGQTRPEAVAAVLVHHDTDRYDLTIRAGHHDAVIHTTASHLFWVPSLNKFLPASNLKPGTNLKTPDGQAAIVVGGSTPAVHYGWMWDLTIQDDHDFYIDIATTAVLVHNCPTSWGNSDTLEDHFLRHGADFGATSPEDYANQASDFFENGVSDNLPIKIDEDGVIRLYDPDTNTFGAYNPDGTTRTFFSPSSSTYWLRQPGVEPWTP